MKKIVLIRSTYSAFGGVERVTLGLARGLLARGIEVTLLTFPDQQWPLTHPLFRIVPMGIFHTHRLIQAWSFNRAVCRFLADHSFDIVFSLDKVTRFTHLHAGGGTHKTFLKIKNNYSSPVSRIFRRLSLFHHYMLRLERLGFENPMLKKVRCNSNLVLHDIIREYNISADKLTVIHSGIRWKDMADAYANRAKIGAELCRCHNIDPAWHSLLFLGSGFDRKGLDIAIRGLSSLPTIYHLVVVGKGNPKPYLRLSEKMGCKERIHFLGPHPQGWRFASFCMALVLPSQYDPFGGASAEGHAMGIPVLVSDKTGYVDRVEHGVNGIVLNTPISSDGVHQAFNKLAGLIEKPKWLPDQFRQHARYVDDDIVLDKLLEEFISV